MRDTRQLAASRLPQGASQDAARSTRTPMEHAWHIYGVTMVQLALNSIRLVCGGVTVCLLPVIINLKTGFQNQTPQF